MQRLRTFIAVELSPAVKAKARELVNRLAVVDSKISWVHQDQMHLTLKFLGDVPETETPEVCRAVAKAAARIEPFEIVFRGAGAFPTAEHPRSLWIGVEDGADELLALQQAVEESLYQELGFPKERRRFQPHLTVGRVKHVEPEDAARLTELIQSNADFDGDLSVVEEVVTFASFLGRQGARHEALDHAPLAG
jgi:2'-5' RNA ligase